MRAVVFDRYGPPDVLRIEEVDRPVLKDGRILVRVHASTVTRTDTGLRTAEYAVMRVATGLRKPRKGTIGWEFAGVVEEVGGSVSEFRIGERVFGLATDSHAEFVTVRARGPVARMPSSIGFEEAAAVADGGCTALSFFRQVRLRKGQRILIYGASGSIGTAAVQLARHIGAQVRAVCDTRNVEVVRSLGPDEVVDYLQQDFANSGETYDVVLDAVGKLPAGPSRRLLRPGGVYVTAGSPGVIGSVLMLGFRTRFSSRRVKLGFARYRKEDLHLLTKLVEAGAYRPVIDRTYPLEDVVEAHRYVDTEQKTGNVVLTVRAEEAAPG